MVTTSGIREDAARNEHVPVTRVDSPLGDTGDYLAMILRCYTNMRRCVCVDNGEIEQQEFSCSQMQIEGKDVASHCRDVHSKGRVTYRLRMEKYLVFSTHVQASFP